MATLYTAINTNSIRSKAMAFVAAVGLAFGLAQIAQAATTNGYNANVVNYLNGGRPASYHQVGTKTWEERGPRGSKRMFKETHRDEWSIYLYDAPQKTSLQLDLHRKKVGYKDSNNPTQRDIYNITSASSKLSGWLVKKVTFNKGAFIYKGNKKWVETGADGQVRFNFVETGRDDWSVYIKDASRSMSVQIDLHTRKINTGNNTPYTITSSN